MMVRIGCYRVVDGNGKGYLKKDGTSEVVSISESRVSRILDGYHSALERESGVTVADVIRDCDVSWNARKGESA